MPVLDRGGVDIAWESHGDGTPPVLLLPTWSIAPSRMWKLQVPYLARHHRVITFDGRGAGASSRPARAEDYADDVFAADALAVLDAAGVEAAVVVGFSRGACWAALAAAAAPERVLGLVAIGSAIPVGRGVRGRGMRPFDAELDTHEDWAKYNRHYWLRDYRGFLDWFAAEMCAEPHSTRQVEQFVEWGLEIDPALLATIESAPKLGDAESVCRAIRCPVLAIHGDADRIQPLARGERLAELTGGELAVLEGVGHASPAREPVAVNALLHDFAARFAARAPPRRWRRALARPRRALYVSSPIGLGHVRRDLAIARELRLAVPGLEIDWLAQEPTRRALQAAGERVHPASGRLLAEAAHVDAWAGDHELWAFECIRRMEEILTANYMLFRDVAHAEPYDLWIGDEAWELDHFLHENPEDKRAPFVWLTDFVGWLALPEHGEREAMLAADLNAEMLEHVARYPWIRDRALFVGDPEDVVEDAFGPGLPAIREWTERHFAFTGQIVPACEPRAAGDGGGPLCVVSAGGSAVGATLLRDAAAALPLLRERVPDARMLIAAGPRLDLDGLAGDGLEVAGYLPDLDRVLAGCDVALAHGGLTTGMELIAAGRPFVSVPLRRHFEQQRHVRHRLERHGHRRVLDADAAGPERLADELARALAEPVAYRPVAAGGAARAASLIAELL